MNQIFSTSILPDPYTFPAPALARTATVSFVAPVNDWRGGSDMAQTQLTVYPTQTPGQPPSGQVVATPLEGPVGTTVEISFNPSDPDGGNVVWGYTLFGGACCGSSSATYSRTITRAGAFRVRAQAIDSELNLSPADSVVIRIGGALGEPPIADMALDVVEGPAPLTVNYDLSGSIDPDGGYLDYSLLCDVGEGISVFPSVPPTGSCSYVSLSYSLHW